jgi:hypothetical protein
MLSALIVGVRFRLSITLTVVAALSFALPPAALAMGHGPNTMACLSQADAVDHGMIKPAHKVGSHVHGADHASKAAEGGSAPSSAHPMTCCGLFCLNAILASESQIAAWQTLGVPHRTLATPRFLSRVPELPERPPNTRLSV